MSTEVAVTETKAKEGENEESFERRTKPRVSLDCTDTVVVLSIIHERAFLVPKPLLEMHITKMDDYKEGMDPLRFLVAEHSSTSFHTLLPLLRQWIDNISHPDDVDCVRDKATGIVIFRCNGAWPAVHNAQVIVVDYHNEADVSDVSCASLTQPQPDDDDDEAEAEEAGKETATDDDDKQGEEEAEEADAGQDDMHATQQADE